MFGFSAHGRSLAHNNDGHRPEYGGCGRCSCVPYLAITFKWAKSVWTGWVVTGTAIIFSFWDKNVLFDLIWRCFFQPATVSLFNCFFVLSV